MSENRVRQITVKPRLIANKLNLQYGRTGADTVTLPSRKHPSPTFDLCRRGGDRPRFVGLGSQGSKSGLGDQMGLGVEGIVDGGAAGEEPLG